MLMALFAILAVLAGLIIRERGLQIVHASPRSMTATRAGLRASAFGAFIALIAAPWVIIGLMTSPMV